MSGSSLRTFRRSARTSDIPPRKPLLDALLKQTALMSTVPTVVYIYGPPAVGKLTVATALHAQTGYRLFHNHLTVDPIKTVFDFASPPFIEVVQRLRLDVFETAVRHDIDLIFTNNSVWGIPNGRALFLSFAEDARQRVEMAGGRMKFVQLVAPREVLESRVGSTSRRDRRKLVDADRLRELLESFEPDPIHPDDLVIDTSALEPSEAASLIAAQLEVPDFV